ncbi:pro-sigmaK processing inhibitor BofA family protein [Clostridium sp. LBM24168]
MFQFEYIGYFLIAILGLYILVKVFAWPIKILFKLLVNAVLGALLLILVNFIGSYFGFYIGINAITAIIAGFFGIPGVIFLIVFKLFF